MQANSQGRQSAKTAIRRDWCRRETKQLQSFGCQAISRWEHQHNCDIFACASNFGPGIGIAQWSFKGEATCDVRRLGAGNGWIHSRKESVNRKPHPQRRDGKLTAVQSPYPTISKYHMYLPSAGLVGCLTTWLNFDIIQNMISTSSNNNNKNNNKSRIYLVAHPSWQVDCNPSCYKVL